MVVDAESAGVNHQIDIIHATCISLYIGLQNCGSGINSVAGCIGAASPLSCVITRIRWCWWWLQASSEEVYITLGLQGHPRGDCFDMLLQI